MNMSSPSAAIVQNDESMRIATNAVLEQQRRRADECETGTRIDPFSLYPASGKFERLLCEILAAVGWRGENRRIFEALPHLTPIQSVRTLRTVLARLDVHLLRIERTAAELEREELPCLVVGEDNSSLLSPAQGGTVAVYDLASENRRYTSPSSLRGQVYLIRAHMAASQPAGLPHGGFVGHVLKYLRGSVGVIVGQSAIINALGLALSLYVLLVYDIVIATKSLDTLVFLAAGAFVALALELRLRRARSRRIAYLAARFDGIASAQALASVLNLPLSLIERAPLALQLSRFRQFEIGRELFAGNLTSALFDLPFTILFVVMLFAIGGLLGFVPIALSLLIVIVCGLCATISTSQVAKVNASKLKTDALLYELTDKLRAIRNASAETTWLARYATSLAGYLCARLANLQFGTNLQAATSALVALAGVVTLGVGALRVMDGAMSGGSLIAAMIVVWRVLVPVQIVSLNLARLQQMLSTVRQINEVVRMGTEREVSRPSMPSRRLGGNIHVARLYLSLGNSQEPQLRGVTIDIGAGQIVALTGPSGSGKSTLLKALLGLYPQYMGTIRLDGLDLRQLEPAELRSAIGYVSQQPTFFYGSVAANFRFANPDATDTDVMEALAALGVRLPARALPAGLATSISGTKTRSISPGLLCRLSIARALVKKPPILLLDDPGNSLDHAGDKALLALLNALRGRTTVVLVTARPSHMRIADRVVELRGGVVAADGKPEIIVPRILAKITAHNSAGFATGKDRSGASDDRSH